MTIGHRKPGSTIALRGSTACARAARSGVVSHERSAHGALGFTLVETLVVLAVIALLLSLLLPVLHSVRGRMRTLLCSSKMRTVAFDFQLFAEGETAEGQGRSASVGGRSFYINDFQDSLYHTDEFWDAGDSPTATLESSSAPLMCPAGAPTLTKSKGFPCGSDAVGPAPDVSIAANMRFYRAVVEFNGLNVLAPSASTRVPASVLSHPYAPLALDVDGQEARRRGIEPFYTAPALPGEEDPYASNRYWMPSMRHQGQANVAFVGGHVLSSPNPAEENWDWAYQARAGR